MLDKTKITETPLSDRTRMNDYNLDQRTAVTMRDLKAELNESNLRIDLQIKDLAERLEVLQERRDKQVCILQGIEGLRI